MKNASLIIFTFLLLFLSACEKKADADFSTDKTEYVAGETVKLTNTSKSGSSFVWIMPNGEDETTKNAEYQIPFNQGFDELSFNLTVKSKGRCIRDSKTISVNVIPSSWWIWTNQSISVSQTFVPHSVTAGSDVNNYWIYAAYARPYVTYYDLGIGFPPGSMPAAGNYTLQSSKTGLLPFTAFVNLSGGDIELPPSSFDFVTGIIQVEYVNGKLHLFFTDIYTNPTTFKLSADIYKP